MADLQRTAYTHVSGHPSAAGRAQDRESTSAKDRRSTTEPTPPTGKLFGDRAILSMQNCLYSSIMIQLLKLFPLINFLFPVLNGLYLGVLEEYSLGIWGKLD